MDVEFVDGANTNHGSKAAGSFLHHTETGNTGHTGLGGASAMDAHLLAEQDKNIDWSKVGKVYKQSEQIESIIEKEMARLKIVMDKRINAQDIELEEKALVARGKKK